ncbi:MAG: DUF4124 domain-containing protein [Halioglobus sp.]
MSKSALFRCMGGPRALLALGLTGICLSWTGPSLAEIYRWVDDNGRVHFGDRPKNPDTAASATPIDIQQAYQPVERTAQDVETYRQEQERVFNYQTERAARERAEKAEQAAAARAQLDEICARYADDVRKFSSLTPDADGRLVRYYIEENGKSVSEERQRKLVAELREEMARAGCR